MPKDVIITPASGKLDFYGTTGGPVLANINLTDNNDLSLSTTSGNLIIGDASRDVYIGDGTNEVDIVFEQNGEIRSVAGKYITVNAGTVNATGVAVNTSSPIAVMHVYGSTPSGIVLNVEGTNGSLFSVIDNLDGTLMSVNNNAGLPVLEVFSDDRIVGGRFGQNDFVVSSSGNVGIGVANPSTKLEVSGTIKATNFSGVGTSLTAGYAQNIVGEDGGGYSASVLPPGGAIPYISEIGTTVFRTIGSANQVLKSNGDNPVWGSVQYSEIGGTAPTWNQNTTGTSAGVIRTVTGTNSAELVRCNMADNDNFRILAGATATNAGYVEIATSDDGTEPIYIRQYTGAFATLTRTATILDGAGNTSFPGSVTANSLVKSGGTSSQFLKADGSVDSSTYLTSLSHNHGIANSAGTQQFTFGINDNVRIAGGGATSIAFDSATKQVTISSTDTNTTYTANNGIVLNGTTFSHVDTSSQGSVDNSNGTVIQDVTLDTYGHVTALGSVNLDGRYYTESEVDTLLSSKLDTSLKGTNNGLAELDSTGKVPSAQLPSYVDDVLEYADLASFPTSGEESKIYIAWDTNKTYRWSGTGYIEISASLALGESGSTAYRGDRGKTAYDHSQVTTGAIHGSSTVGTALFRISNNSTSIKFIRVNADNTLTYRTGSEVLSDIGAYAATNPNGYTTNTGTVTSVAGTGSVAGLTLTGTVTTTGNLTLGGTLSTPVSTINDSTTVGQNLVKLTNPSAVRFLRINANNTVDALTDSQFRTAIGAGTSSTTGTVTSVGLSLPDIFNVSGSPISSNGTLSAGFVTQASNTVFAGPSSGNGTPSFRALVAADIPTLNQNTTGTAANITATSNTTLTTLSNLVSVGTIATGVWSASTIDVNKGGTGATTFTSGEVLVGNGTSAVSTLSRSGIDSRSTFPPSSHSITAHSATAWRMFFSNATTSAIQELAFGNSGTFLKSSGPSANPTWSTLTSSDVGLGNVANVAALPLAGGTMTGAISFAAGQTWPTFNQNTTGSAATLTNARTLTIGSTSRTFNGSANISWTLADIGAQATLTNPVTGTGTNNYVSKWTGATTQANSLIYDNGTNVGVGITTPNAKVHVYGTVASGVLLNVEGTNGSLFSVIDDLTGSLMSVNTVAGLPVLEVFDDYKVVAGRYNQNDFVISSSGNVGIGKVPNNSYKLDVNGKLNLYNSTSLSNAQIYVEDIDGYLLLDSNTEVNINSTFLYINSDAQANGSFTATSFIGNGSGLTGTAASLTAGSVTTNANLTGDVTSVGNTTSIAAGVIVNADINVSAAIADTKLATISTAGKVANSATTATNANTASAIVARDASGNFSAGTITAALNGNANTVTNGVYTTGNQSVGGVKTFTSQIINTTANSTANGGGQIYLNGATGNRIDFNTNGVAAPTFTTRSVGTKIVLYPVINAGNADYAIGIENATLWNSIPTTNEQFKWYGGTTNVATLTGAGVLTVAGSTSQINVDNLKLDNNIVGVNSNNTNIQILASGINSNVYLGPIPPTSSAPGENGFGVTADSLYVYDSFGFGESNDTVGEGIKFTYAGGVSTLRVNNGGGNGGSVFKATADSGIDTQGRLTLNTLTTNTHATKINEILQITTSNNTANTIMLRSYSTSKLILPAQSTWCFIINLSAYNSTDNIGAAWIFKGAIRRNNSGGTALIGSVLEENWKETGMIATSANVVANDTDDSLDIRVTGLSSKTIRWTASIDLTQANQ